MPPLSKLQLAAGNDLAGVIDGVHLKPPLGEIKTDRGNLTR